MHLVKQHLEIFQWLLNTRQINSKLHGMVSNILHNFSSHRSSLSLPCSSFSSHAGLDSKASLPEIYLSIHVENTCFSVAKLCVTLCNPMDCSKPGFPIPHYLPDLSSIIFQGQAWVKEAWGQRGKYTIIMVSLSWSSQPMGKTEKYHMLVREVLVRTNRKPLASCGWSGRQSSSLDLREGTSGFFFFFKGMPVAFFLLFTWQVLIHPSTSNYPYQHLLNSPDVTSS